MRSVALPVVAFTASLVASAQGLAGQASPPEPSTTATPALPFTVQARIAPGRVQIGERITLTLTIEAPPGLISTRPRLDDRLGELEILGVEASAETRSIERWRQRWTISLTSFETGRIDIPDIPIEYVAVDGRTFVAPWSPRLSVELAGPGVTADTPLRGLAVRLDAPPPSRWRSVLIGAAAVAVIAPLAGIPLVRWWLRRLNRARHAAFYRSLSAELAQLASSPCADEGDARVRYTRASALVRQGVAPVANGPIDAMTSRELAARVSTTAHDRGGLGTRLGVLLRAVDAVRFGNRAPAIAQHSATLLEAQHVVGGMGSLAGERLTVKPTTRKGTP